LDVVNSVSWKIGVVMVWKKQREWTFSENK